MDYENNVKSKKGIVLIVVLVLIIINRGINEDIISNVIKESKIKNIMKNDEYYVETSFEKAVLEKFNTHFVLGGKNHGSAYTTSLTVRTTETNKQIKILIIGEKWTKYQKLLNKDVMICKFTYHKKQNNKIVEEYKIISTHGLELPDLLKDFEHRGIRYICNYNYEDIIQLKTPIDVKLDFVNETSENMSIYEASKNLKPSYESIYGNCYVYNKNKKWCLYLEHPEEYYVLRRKGKMLWFIIRNVKRRFSR